MRLVKKIGRPSKYDSQCCELVIKLMSEGYSKQAVAGELGISRDTIYEWCRSHKEFSDTIKIGEAKSLLYWEKIGIDGMKGKIEGFQPSVWIFIMKNRFGWRDNSSKPEDPPIGINHSSSIQGIVAKYKNHTYNRIIS